MLSIIVPCYNEQETIEIFYTACCQVVSEMDEDIEFIFVDDGSKDETLRIVEGLAEKDDRVKFMSFSRNFGKEAAMYAGLCGSSGEYVVIMDSDLQDPPALLPEMLKYIKSGEYDSVATRRVTRKGEPPVRSFFARMFYRIINRMTSVEIVDGARDYRMMNRSFADALISLSERCRFSKGLFGWVGFKTKWLEFENIERVAGETKWSFWKLFIYAMDGIVAFSTLPLVFSTILGFIMTVISMLMLIVIVVRKLIFNDPVVGWTSLVCIMIFLGSIIMFSMGILGQYIAKSYTELKNRPIFICKKTNISDKKTNSGKTAAE